MSTKIIVLAAGKGTRMKSATPKVLHKLAGKSLLQHVLDNVARLEPEGIYTVIGHGAEQVVAEIGDAVTFVTQTEQKGTGHAVQQALDYLAPDDDVIIAYGDVPLTQPDTFSELLSACHAESLGLLTVNLDDPTGYGRILRDEQQRVTGIVEHKDATDTERTIQEVNTGMLSVKGGVLKDLLSRINNDNAQGEYYLTDIFALAVAEGMRIQTVQPDATWEVAGVNSRIQLAELERVYQQTIAEQLMANGVTLADPQRLDVRGELRTGQDVEIDVNCVFEGDVVLGDNVVIGPNCLVRNAKLADGCVVHANCVIEEAEIGADSTVGPFARIRPGTHLKGGAHIGNFVEIKNATIDLGSKVNHLSYVGDCDIGQGTNVGAGTITCNYDGANKHRTVMGNNVFIGSNAALVAPVTINDGATVGAGSVITQDVAEQQLAFTRAPQTAITDWQRPTKNK
ncbi:MAG TPA: UDP-N-acetylglucosamine diphosphorylase/glucosamine-1-phosphate N-acetyltransferase [Gammaproteobacteria bacterium]|jgi:bifunctional UDP-N-acetylglucosamine pyrophosphorylase/glucosamine-1-phosphate N-acetyltransferase|nr:UDP-N-acetylglucosamine diphosphorylase/glucosamine-1-phosphate N-acetyltransferase [Gammaproteobacteria bacterium]